MEKKPQLYGGFNQLTSDISHEKTWTSLRKWKLKRESESLLRAAQNNTIRTYHNKARIDKTQQNCRCRLCGDKDERINHIISECCKLAQKECKTRHGWVGKVIHWELCKKFKFDFTNKWCMHHSESVQENETHKLLWDFEIQTDNLISARRPDLVIITPPIKEKITSRIVNFCVPADYGIRFKESEKKDKYLDLAKKLKKNQKLWNMKVTRIPIEIGAFGTVTKILVPRTGGFGNKRTNGDHPNNSIIEIGQNTEKSPGDLKRLVVTQTSVRNHRQTLVRKTRKGINNNKYINRYMIIK